MAGAGRTEGGNLGRKGMGGKSIKITQAKFVNVILKSSHAYYWNLTWFL